MPDTCYALSTYFVFFLQEARYNKIFVEGDKLNLLLDKGAF